MFRKPDILIIAAALLSGCSDDSPPLETEETTSATTTGGTDPRPPSASTSTDASSTGPRGDTGGASDSTSSTSTSGTTASETGASSSSSSSSSSGAPAGCSDHQACTDPEAPLCDASSGDCFPCDAWPEGERDTVCAERDPALPLCVAGACVACSAESLGACGGTTPLCDVETHTCVGCTAHEQCPPEAPAALGAACNLLTGACLASSSVSHVDGDHTTCPGMGTLEQPFCSITAALERVEEGASATIFVHPRESEEGLYDEAVTLDGSRTVALFAPPGDVSLWRANRNPQLTVLAGSTALLEGLAFLGNAQSEGIRVEGAIAHLDRCRVMQNAGGGITGREDARLFIRSSFVSSPNNRRALELDDSTAEILYSTLGGDLGRSRALACTDSTATVRNSVLVARGSVPAVDCPGIQPTHVFIGDLQTEPAFDTAWFTGYDLGNFHLGPAHPFADVAVWQPGDPVTDIDGDPRPATTGSSDVAGADIPRI